MPCRSRTSCRSVRMSPSTVSANRSAPPRLADDLLGVSQDRQQLPVVVLGPRHGNGAHHGSDGGLSIRSQSEASKEPKL
eukprot:2568363-Heterocapsa_arctica.AAC.1